MVHVNWLLLAVFNAGRSNAYMVEDESEDPFEIDLPVDSLEVDDAAKTMSGI